MDPRLLVLLSAVLFGTTGTAQALGPDGTEPVGVGAARVLVGAALLALAARAVTSGSLRPGRAALGVVAVAGLGVAAYQLCFFAAVDDTGVAVGTVVALGSGPAFAGALGWAVLGRRPEARWAAATALACAGVALMVLAGDASDVSAPGIALALGAGAAYATYTVAAKVLLDRGEPPERVMAQAFGAGAVLLAPVLAATGGGNLGSAGGLALVLYLGAVPTAVAYVLFARGLRHLSAGDTATLTLAEPVTAAALGAVVLGERPPAVAVAGALLVLAGLAVLALGRTPATAPAGVPG